MALGPPRHVLPQSEMDEFARSDGFLDAADMAAYWEAPLGSRDTFEIGMVLVAWRPLETRH